MYQDLLTKNPSRHGYTLIEVLISMLIFGIVAVGISLPFQESFELTARSENILKASTLAKAYLQEVDVLWQNQLVYDAETMPEMDSKYTDDDNYQVDVEVESIDLNSDGTDKVKRLTISYLNATDTTLVNYFMDYNRPSIQ